MMFLTELNNLLEEIQSGNLSNDELCRHLSLNTMRMLGSQATYLATVDDFGVVHISGKFGFRPEMLDSWHLRPLSDNRPSTDAIRFSKFIWENTLPKWSEQYADLENYNFVSGANSFIAWPVLKGKTPVGSIGFFSEHNLNPTAELEYFLIAVGRLSAIHLASNGASSTQYSGGTGNRKIDFTALTERQLEVLNYLSQNLSNAQISSKMGYSLGTVRLETIKIYKILGVTNRHEAASVLTSQSP